MSRPRKYATTSEAEIRALCAEGLTFPQIAARLNVPLIPLRNAASLLGIASGRRHETNLPLSRWVDELAAGATLDEVGKAHGKGVTRQSVYNALKRRGLPTTTRAAVKFKALQAQKESARVAQLAEQPLCMVQVAGSIPVPGSTSVAA